MLSDWVAGAWRREGRRVGEAPFGEPSAVLWLCAPPVYADLRVYQGAGEAHDLDRTQAFSGRVLVDGEVVTWEHDLDTTNRYAAEDEVDSAPLLGDENELREVGEGYEERWVRAAPRAAVVSAAECCDATGTVTMRVVRVGDTAIAVRNEPPSGLRMERDERGGWRTTHVVGAGEELLRSAVEVVNRPGSALPEGWSRAT